ncbi:hypothetical protein [Thauera mechernichensis]
MIFKEQMMNTSTSLTSYRFAAAVALAAAIYTTFTWVFSPFLNQTEIRSQVGEVCRKSKACREIDASLVINRVSNRLERRLVVRIARGTPPKEAAALVKAINELVQVGINKTGAVTRSANSGLLPLEVRHD